MNKDEILAKSRAENKNKDVYEQEVLKQASRSAVVVQMSFATLFFVTQIMTGGGINWGLWAIVFSANMTINWVKYIKLRRNYELLIAISYTVLVLVISLPKLLVHGLQRQSLKQSALAEMVGVSRNTISSIETGQFNPTAKLALILCIALDKKFEELFYF